MAAHRYQILFICTLIFAGGIKHSCLAAGAVSVQDSGSWSGGGRHIKVFLLAGQSNAAGSGLNSEYPAKYQIPQNDVEFWVGGRLPNDGFPSYTYDRPASTEFGPLKLGSGNLTDSSTSGSEMSLGRVLKDAMPSENIAIIKYAMSGSALQRGLRPEGAGDWDPDELPINNPYDGVRYRIFRQSAVLAALNAITSRGDTYEIAGMFWMQGETDAGNENAANAYQANLRKLIKAVKINFSAPDMLFVTARLHDSTSRTYLSTVRKAMEDTALSDDYAYVVDTDDLALNADNLHFSAAGQVALGERFAKLWLHAKNISRTEPVNPGAYSEKIRIACVGDSITYGYGIVNRETNSYPAYLQTMLGSNYDVRNFGRSGARVYQGSSNPYKGSPEYNAAIAFNPHVVIICLGINDAGPEWTTNRNYFVNHFRDLIDDFSSLSATPAPKIWLGTLMPVFSWQVNFGYVEVNKPQADIMVSQVAAEMGVSLIDLFTPLDVYPNYYTDGIHPLAQGAAVIAGTVNKAVTGDFGGLKLPPVFSSHMVLQRDTFVPVFGTADVGQSISVTLNSLTKTTASDSNGRWRVNMPLLAAGGPYTMTVTGNTVLNFTDILAGEVWVCAGQSNMYLPLSGTDHASEDISSSDNYPNIRFLDMRGNPYPNNYYFSQAQMNKCTTDTYYDITGWQVASSSNVGNFSAVAYLYGKELNAELGVPVGLIHNSVGGTSTESYVSRSSLQASAQLKPMLKDWLNNPLVAEWCNKVRASANLHDWLANPLPPMPRHPYEPAFLYDAGIKSLIPYAIRGAVWYQGESNATDAALINPTEPVFQKNLFETLVNDWRLKWQQGDFPFLYVQLPNLNRPWMYYRQMQLEALSDIENSGMAGTIDIGDTANVHPVNKREVARRLALWAKARTYGRTGMVYSGPLYDSTTVGGNAIRVRFSHTGTGLATSDGKALVGFEIAADDGIYKPAGAVIQGHEVVVSSPQISNPVSVRYAWAPNPVCNLVNSAMLPASPFTSGNLEYEIPLPAKKHSFLFEHKYEAFAATADIENAIEGWQLVSNAAGGNLMAVSKGMLSYATVSTSGARDAEQKDSSDAWAMVVGPDTSWSIEIRAKVTAAGGADAGLHIWGCGGGNDTGFFAIRTDSVIWGHTTSTQTTLSSGLDNASDFHIYRLAYQADYDVFQLWRDDVLIGKNLKDALTYNYTWLIFGDTGSSSYSAAVIDYFRWDATGAYSPSNCIAIYNGDMNGDCDVDMMDLVVFTEHWLDVGCMPPEQCGGANLTTDQQVGPDDMIVLADNWLNGLQPAGYWKFDEGSGVVAADSSGNGNNCMLVNFPSDNSQWIAGAINGGLLCDGIDDYLQITGYKGITGTAVRTCMTWVRDNGGGAFLFWGSASGQTGGIWVLRINGGYLEVGVYGGYVKSSLQINDGNWHHIAVALANDGMPELRDIQFYIDGRLDDGALPSNTGSLLINTGNDIDFLVGAQIGGLPGNSYFKGQIDDVRIYGAALSASQILGMAVR